MDLIRSIVEALLRTLLPASGAHRRTMTTGFRPPTAATYPDASTARVPPVPAPVRVRPYVLARERRRDVRARRARRRVLWLALHGVDLGPRVMHGVRVVGS